MKMVRDRTAISSSWISSLDVGLSGISRILSSFSSLNLKVLILVLVRDTPGTPGGECTAQSACTPRCTAVSRHPHLCHGPRPPQKINWEPHAGKEPNQCDKHPGFDGMPENHFNFSRANAVRPKDVGVGGLVGYTNGFTLATPLNLRLERVALIGKRGPCCIGLAITRPFFTLQSGSFYLFVWGGYTSWLVSVSLLEEIPFLTERRYLPHSLWLLG